MDDIERPLVVEQDGAPVRRPAPPVLEERQAPWGDPPHAGAIEIDDEERHVRVGVAARVGHAEALAGESRAVRRPAAPTGGFEGGIGPLELAEGSGVGIYDRRRAVLLAVAAGG